MGVGADPGAALKTLGTTLNFIESQVGSFTRPDEFEMETSNFKDVAYAVRAATKRIAATAASAADAGGETKGSARK